MDEEASSSSVAVITKVTDAADISNNMFAHLEMLPLLRVRQTCRALRSAVDGLAVWPRLLSTLATCKAVEGTFDVDVGLRWERVKGGRSSKHKTVIKEIVPGGAADKAANDTMSTASVDTRVKPGDVVIGIGNVFDGLEDCTHMHDVSEVPDTEWWRIIVRSQPPGTKVRFMFARHSEFMFCLDIIREPVGGSAEPTSSGWATDAVGRIVVLDGARRQEKKPAPAPSKPHPQPTRSDYCKCADLLPSLYWIWPRWLLGDDVFNFLLAAAARGGEETFGMSLSYSQYKFPGFKGNGYLGNFRHGRSHGRGRWCSADGTFQDGEFQEGEFIRGRYRDGPYRGGVFLHYSGECKGWLQHGRGSAFFPGSLSKNGDLAAMVTLTADRDGDKYEHEVLVEDIEALVKKHVNAVEHVLVVGNGRSFLSCLLTLKTKGSEAAARGEDPAALGSVGHELAAESLAFAQQYGSEATTVLTARACTKFRGEGIATHLARVNKEIKNKHAVRKFAILTSIFSVRTGELLPGGELNRLAIENQLMAIINGMYHDEGLGPQNHTIKRNEGTRRQPYQYTGDFFNGLRHGRGTYTHTNGGTWQSEWDHDRPCSIVTYTYPNGIMWEGRCSRLGMGDGWGMYTIDGTQHEGEWHLGGPEEAKRAAIEDQVHTNEATEAKKCPLGDLFVVNRPPPCPEGHGLFYQTFEVSQWADDPTCDKCRRSRRSAVYSCERCNFDLCDFCYEEERNRNTTRRAARNWQRQGQQEECVQIARTETLEEGRSEGESR